MADKLRTVPNTKRIIVLVELFQDLSDRRASLYAPTLWDDGAWDQCIAGAQHAKRIHIGHEISHIIIGGV